MIIDGSTDFTNELEVTDPQQWILDIFKATFEQVYVRGRDFTAVFYHMCTAVCQRHLLTAVISCPRC
jgi:hypothetical protein